MILKNYCQVHPDNYFNQHLTFSQQSIVNTFILDGSDLI